MAYAAEGFTKSFLGTLQGLTALERAQLEAEDYRERKSKEKQFRDITAEELGRVGALPQTSTGAIREAAGITPQQSSAIPVGEGAPTTLRQAAGIQEGASSVGAQATASPASTTPISREDAFLRIMERGMAVDSDKAFDIALKGLQLEDVLATSKQKKEFRTWQNGFNTELANLKRLADTAETNPTEFIAGAKKLGIDVRPVSTGGGKQIFEAYMGGNKIGQYATLQDAANDGLDRYSMNMISQGAARFATSADQLVSIMSTAQRLDLDRKRAQLEEERVGFEKSRLRIEEDLAPTRKRQAEAAINASNAAAEGANYDNRKKALLTRFNEEYQELLKDPVANADRIKAKAAEMEALFPEVYTKPVTVRNEDGSERATSIGLLSNAASSALSSAGVPNIPPAARKKAESLASRGLNALGKPATPTDIADYESTFGPWPGPRKAPPGAARPSAIPSPERAAAFGPSEYTRLTPVSTLQEAAQRGDTRAIAELKRRQEVEAARTMQTPGYNPSGF